MTKECRDCGAEKPLDEFAPAKKNRDGRGSYCRDCLRVRHARYREQARGRPSTRAEAGAAPPGTKWCPRCETYQLLEAFGRNRSSTDGLTAYCRPCHNDKSRENREARHGSSRNYHLKARYGITAAEYDAMLEAQGGLCALCRERPAEHVDHDHAFGNVRGLLCSCCNQGLGNFRDDLAHVQAAATYLERTTWRREQVSTGVFQLTSPRPAPAASPPSSRPPLLISSLRA